MKKIPALVFALSLSALLISCGGEPAGESAPAETAVTVNADEIINAVVTNYSLTDGFVFTSSSTEAGEYLDADMILGYYGDAADVPDFTKIAEYCIYIDESDPDVYTDVGLFRMADPAYAETFVQYLEVRVSDKIAEADQYPTRDVPTLEAAVFETYGDYVYYVVSTEVDAITADIEAALGK